MEFFNVIGDTFERGADFETLVRRMRSKIPIDGIGWARGFRLILHPGAQSREHTHTGWVGLYYIDAADTPLVVGDVKLFPAPGSIVIIPPETMHHVPQNVSDRVRMTYHIMVTEPGDDRPPTDLEVNRK